MNYLQKYIMHTPTGEEVLKSVSVVQENDFHI